MSATYCEKISRKQKKNSKKRCSAIYKKNAAMDGENFSQRKRKIQGTKIITMQRYKNALYQETG